MNIPALSGFFFRTAARLILAVLFVGIPAGLIYLNRVGFGESFTTHLGQTLSGETHTVRIGKLTLDPFQGLVASSVVLTGEHGRPLGRINRATVGLNLSELINGHIRIESLELLRAHLAVPLDAPDATLVLQNVNARVVLVPGHLRLTQCEFVLASVNVRVTGNFLNPELMDVERLEPGEDGSHDLAIVRDVLDVLHEIKYADATPVLEAELGGDLSDFETLEVTGLRLRSGPAAWRGIAFEKVAADGTYRNGVFGLDYLSAETPGGKLDAWAEFSESERTGRFEATSTLDPAMFLDLVSAPDTVREVEWKANPAFDVTGEITWVDSDPPLSLSLRGRIRAEDITWRGLTLALLQADFAWKDGTFLTREAMLAGETLSGTLDLMASENDLRVRFDGSANPGDFLPLLEGGARRELEIMRFEEPVSLRAEFRSPGTDFANATAEGTFRFGRTSRRGAWIDAAEAGFHFENKILGISNLRLRSNEARGAADFVFDFNQNKVRIERVESTMPPVDVMQWIDPKIADAIRPFRFNAPPSVTGSGIVDLATPDGNRLDFQVESADGLRYDVLGKTLGFGATRAAIRVRQDQLQVNITRAALFGGTAAILADVSLNPATPVYSASINLREIEFKKLTELYFDYDESEGKLRGTYQFRSRMDDEENMTGSGSLVIEGGNVFAIPILGPLSLILNEILPGAGFQVSRRATTDFDVAEGKITTDNLEIEGRGFSMFGEGVIDFVKDDLDMAVRINAKGVPGIVFFPVSKLFEYVSEGSISDPVWRPKRVPSQLFGTPSRTEPQED